MSSRPARIRQQFVLWDLDGTLADTLGDLAVASNAVLAERGLPPIGEESVRSFIGGGAEQLLRRVLGEAAAHDLPGAVASFQRHYAAALCVHTRAYPGIDAVVRALCGRQAVVTNKPGPLARPLIAQLGWGEAFRAVVGGGDAPRKKPAPDLLHEALRRSGADLADAVLVGDSEYDLLAARHAGIPFVFVRWGFSREDCSAGAHAVADRCDELAELLGA